MYKVAQCCKWENSSRELEKWGKQDFFTTPLPVDMCLRHHTVRKWKYKPWPNTKHTLKWVFYGLREGMVVVAILSKKLISHHFQFFTTVTNPIFSITDAAKHPFFYSKKQIHVFEVKRIKIALFDMKILSALNYVCSLVESIAT